MMIKKPFFQKESFTREIIYIMYYKKAKGKREKGKKKEGNIYL